MVPEAACQARDDVAVEQLHRLYVDLAEHPNKEIGETRTPEQHVLRGVRLFFAYDAACRWAVLLMVPEVRVCREAADAVKVLAGHSLVTGPQLVDIRRLAPAHAGDRMRSPQIHRKKESGHDLRHAPAAVLATALVMVRTPDIRWRLMPEAGCFPCQLIRLLVSGETVVRW
ncbi:hypothetical protein FJT64_024651 [Amphibalanus amphitrite]|uniref:Uncharacterized protein n=1 Tax=Amphibalanus amphitrite TaxID=1232801 RepID=A0A6A4WA12_AMPAM|nr:hypothetical protein FJT64_024651 [Amphibalanus amphitrite]